MQVRRGVASLVKAWDASDASVASELTGEDAATHTAGTTSLTTDAAHGAGGGDEGPQRQRAAQLKMNKFNKHSLLQKIEPISKENRLLKG